MSMFNFKFKSFSLMTISNEINYVFFYYEQFVVHDTKMLKLEDSISIMKKKFEFF